MSYILDLLEQKTFNENNGLLNNENEKCPICDHDTEIVDYVDFNKNNDHVGINTNSGIPIAYNLCDECGFLFSPEMHKWTPDQFSKYVYNDTYIKRDPDYVYIRASEDAEVIIKRFSQHKDTIRHLDYGGGEGVLSKILRDNGFNSTSYDPFVNKDININDLGKFDLITSFEVFEHVPDVHNLMATLTSLRKPDGIIYFSTLTSDGNFEKNKKIDWWYAVPRVGHISLYSNKTLIHLSKKYNMILGSLSNARHVMWDIIPDWAKGTIL